MALLLALVLLLLNSIKFAEILFQQRLKEIARCIATLPLLKDSLFEISNCQLTDRTLPAVTVYEKYLFALTMHNNY